MATLPTPEESAYKILSVFVDRFKQRPGNVLRLNNFLDVIGKNEIHTDDFNAGMQFAIDQGWIEPQKGGVSFRLTKNGFEQAPDPGANAVRANIQAMQDQPNAKEKQETWPAVFETTFEEYEVIDKSLGEGGSGRVFEVKNEANERFALKCLSPEKISTEKRKRFKNEINFCSKFEHRNIIQVLDSGISVVKGTKCPFYVMPKFRQNLRDLLQHGIPKAEVLHLFNQILDGIDAAHKSRVFHRDLKPENILYDPTANLLVIADFGIAHFEEDFIATPVETKVGAKMANMGYSAPEQRVKGGKVDHRADIFALGLILNEMFTGSVPHGMGYQTIGSIAPEYAYLDALVEWMIQNVADARPDSIDTIKMELIARGNVFVALLKADAKTKEIVPAFEAGIIEPIKLTSADWDNGRLILELNRTPELGWTQRFKQPNAGSWGSIMGSGPEFFNFNGTRAVVAADEGSAQQIIDYTKRYIEMANLGYQNDLDMKARQEEQAYRQKLKQELAAAEARARIVSKLVV